MSQSFMDENSISASFSNSMNLGCKTPGSQKKKKALGVRSSKKEPLCKLGQSLQGNADSKNILAGSDRFVPDRSNVDFDLSNYLVSLFTFNYVFFYVYYNL